MKMYQEEKVKITLNSATQEKPTINILVYIFADFNQHLYAF